MVWKPYKVSWLSYWWATFPLVNINKTPGVEEVGENWAGSPGSDCVWVMWDDRDCRGQTGPDWARWFLSLSLNFPVRTCSGLLQSCPDRGEPGTGSVVARLSHSSHLTQNMTNLGKNCKIKKKCKSFKRKKETWRVKTISVSRPGGQQLVNSNI